MPALDTIAADTLAAVERDTLIDLLRAEQEIASLPSFVRAAWSFFHPSSEDALIWNWHIDCICEHLEAVLPGRQITRLVINVPPGFLKSLLVSVYWPSWLWLRSPSLQIVAASSSGPIALRDAKRQYDLCSSRWYRERYGTDWSFDRKQEAKSYYANDAGGYRISVSSGQRVIGYRGGLNLTDDPLDAAHAYSHRKELAGHVTWYQQSWRTRVNSQLTTPLVLIMQRLHPRDISGVVLGEDGWEYLCLPNEYVPRKVWTCLGRYDPRTEVGELLSPRQIDRKRTEEIKKEIGSRAYSAQFQQDPMPAGGAMIEADWIREYPQTAIPRWEAGQPAPEGWDYHVHSWDTAGSRGSTAAYSVGQVWGVRGARRYLLDQVRARMKSPDLLYAIRELLRRYPGPRAVLIERQSTGKDMVKMLQLEIPGLLGIDPDRSKEARLDAALPQFEAQNVWIPELGSFPWVEDYQRELLSFPASVHSDQVDATTQALNWIHSQSGVGDVWAFSL